MRRYETVYISSPDLSDEEYKEKNLKMQELIASSKGKPIRLEEWGKKKLAYEIKKQSRGFYTLLDYGGTQSVVRELEKILRLDDKVLKYHTIRSSDDLGPEAIQEEKGPEMASSEVEPKQEEQQKDDGIE